MPIYMAIPLVMDFAKRLDPSYGLNHPSETFESRQGRTAHSTNYGAAIRFIIAPTRFS
jgi:hypothetical protein